MADRKNPFKIFPMDVESFLLSTAHMNNAAVGAYTRILLRGWLDLWPVGNFPNDDEVLAELAQSDQKEFQRLKSSVRRRFVEAEGGKILVQRRLRKTYSEVKKKTEDARQQRSEAGKASAAAKAQRKLNDRSTDEPKNSTSFNNRIELNQTKPNRTEKNQTKLKDEGDGGSAAREGLGGNGMAGAGDELLKQVKVSADPDSRFGKVKILLQNLGVGVVCQNELAARPEITVDVVRRMHAELCRTTPDHKPGLLVDKLREHKP